MKMKFIAVIIFVIFISPQVYSEKYEIKAYIESLRKNSSASLLFKKKPESLKYMIIFENTIIGTAEILNSVPVNMNNWKFRASSDISLYNQSDISKIKAGNEIVLSAQSSEKFVSPVPFKITNNVYKKTIITKSDSREMILVPEGKFILGSNNGDPDEKPAKKVFVPAFYLDKYEVSNSNYKIFMDKTNSPAPQSWENGIYDELIKDLPVIVTFYEAVAYSKWAGKRLPTEQEWEKAAKGTGGLDEDTEENLYPWDGKFNPEKSNCSEFWAKEETGRFIKEKYSKTTPGFFPVNSFHEVNSPYGHLHLAGNASEWTSSWYLPYSGNKTIDKKFGKLYKVIRGGDFTSDKLKIRVSNREIGGTPNLYKDNSAGFRCAKDVFSQDRDKK